MPRSGLALENPVAANSSGRLNKLVGFEVVAAGGGAAEIVMKWRNDLTQYAGHPHAGMIAALLDTACGFAAATLARKVTASNFSVNCLKPPTGRLFIANGTTVRAGRKQIFARAELLAEDERAILVATGETLLVPLKG
jgi:uncharacterized protein (TIGR00369 family)